MKAFLVVSLLALLFIAACGGPSVECSKPYMLNGDECCLDNDSNAVCDKDDGRTTAPSSVCKQDCSLCPATIIQRNVTVTKYICPDGKQVDNAALCGTSAPNIFSGFTPSTVNEEGTVIEEFTVRPACRGFNALEIHYKTGTSSPAVTVQVKDAPESDWRDVTTYTGGAADHYIYGVFCENKCTSLGEFFLAPRKPYLVRVKFDFQKVYGNDQYSNEYVIDATEKGEYLTNLC